MRQAHMIRKFAISASAVASLGFCFLALYSSFHRIYHLRELGNHTTVYCSILHEVLRIGWFTGTTRLEVVPHLDAENQWTLPLIHFRLEELHQDADFVPPTQPPQKEVPMHDLSWKQPVLMIGPHTVFQTQVRTWIGTPAILLAIWPLAAFYRGPVRRFHRRRRGQCIQCGYNLSGSTTGVCPECGTLTCSEKSSWPRWSC